VSGVTRRALVQEGVASEKSVVIPNSALLSATASEPVSPPVIGYIGGLQPWQGVEALIDAFAMIAPGYAHVQLMIVHSGNRETRVLERQILDRGLSARVVLRDPLPAAELAALMSQMVCTVAPLADTPRNTHQGCCPVKIVESMAAGVPVVATDLEVCRELIEHGVDGWLVKRGDNRALAQGLERMLQDRSLRKRLADGAKRKALERFSRPVTHSALRRVFRDVAGWGKGGGKWRVS
jgi:glycosyltransferase involved in cell wall biosynthesis